MKPTKKTFPLDVLSIDRGALGRDHYGRVPLKAIAPQAAHMFLVCESVEEVHGLTGIAKRFHTLADCGRMAATFADTGVMT